jgi:pyruvate dehydrogenase E2 component (dihydrolipoamide acetyltransferase)
VSQARQFTLPDLGEGLVDAEVVRWLVRVGDTVAVDQPVVEVESAKATVELPSPFAGVVRELHAEVGATIEVGAPLLSIESADAAGVGSASEPGQAERENAVPAASPGPGEVERDGAVPAASPEPGESSNVLVGYGTSPRRRRARGRASRSRPEGAGVAPGLTAEPMAPRPAPAQPAEPASPRPEAPVAAARPAVVSPVVRRLARSNGIDVAALRGSGPGGLIVRADVEQAIAARTPPAAAPAGEDRRIPLRGRRRAIADKLTRSHQEIPDAATWVDVDATGLLAARDAIASSHPETRIGLLALLARFTVAGLRRFPALNARVDLERQEIVELASVHLGIAAQTEQGLVVPVVRDADRRSTAELASELRRLTEAARAGTLRPEELTGGTFTLNNYGVLGVDGSTPIINHPEVAILGVSRIIDKPWVVDGQLTVRKLAQLTLVFDHRVCDGGVAAGFLRHVADCVEQPARLLGAL